MNTEIIKRAARLLKPIGFEPECTGYYVTKDGEDLGGTFCKDCIDGQVEIAREQCMKERQKILDKYRKIEETGFYNGENIKERHSDIEIQSSKQWELEKYPEGCEFSFESCDPDFSGGHAEPLHCDECGNYFYTDFEPDLEYANIMLEDFGDGKNLCPELKWQLDTAFYNYDYLEEEVKKILMKIAKRIIENNKQ
jgi:hypothetical protein